tara:strand:+ start:2050 stop:2685 length:636 start_codon:yes stop_codon:yes gene_type:complete
MRVVPAVRMNMKIIREYYELCEGGVCQDLLTEADKKFVAEGGMILSGLMQCAETKNGNGRIYPFAILEREVKNYARLVNDKRALGELDHPDSSVINLANASHMVTRIWMDGHKVMGTIRVLNTPAGKILRSLVDDGCCLGISSRGMGSVTERNGTTMVEDDFQLLCFDMVSDPSTPGAFMMTEAKDPTNIFTKEDKIDRALNNFLHKFGEK